MKTKNENLIKFGISLVLGIAFLSRFLEYGLADFKNNVLLLELLISVFFVVLVFPWILGKIFERMKK